ncbi:MAG: TetR/AcrR family transcriptional regulator [Clostridia bacterium]|nr:TetR/AcrR family transcriptional regulator [Clostridia bacterium]
MAKKNRSGTKKKIVSAAWRLFYLHGYDDTTIEEIIEESGTSRGSFYHYFEGKDGLLGSLAYLFDDKYEELEEVLPSGGAMEKLLFLNYELFKMIEESIDIDLLTRLYSTQLVTKGEKHLLDHNRVYYRLLRRIVSEGQQSGELTSDKSTAELVRIYAMCERALIYDWCLVGGNYPLAENARNIMPGLLGSFEKMSI